jgi:hypothetical protein
MSNNETLRSIRFAENVQWLATADLQLSGAMKAEGYRGAGADAERQRQPRHGGETGRLHQHAKSKSNILPKTPPASFYS